jgi:hypothetical protein
MLSAERGAGRQAGRPSLLSTTNEALRLSNLDVNTCCGVCWVSFVLKDCSRLAAAG